MATIRGTSERKKFFVGAVSQKGCFIPQILFPTPNPAKYAPYRKHGVTESNFILNNNFIFWLINFLWFLVLNKFVMIPINEIKNKEICRLPQKNHKSENVNPSATFSIKNLLRIAIIPRKIKFNPIHSSESFSFLQVLRSLQFFIIFFIISFSTSDTS